MVAALRHRGPDEFGAYLDERCGLGQARLSIIDLAGGSQPMANEDESLWITFNGEIYNYLELRSQLLELGHRFRTKSDTEVIIHAYEQWGPDCLSRFNGQFAIALYDRRRRRLFLARDRLGVRPLHYTVCNGRLLFASEIKAIFCDPSVPRRLDLRGLDEIFTWWVTVPPRTAFEGIQELPPGSWMEIANGTTCSGQFWSLSFPSEYDRARPMDSWAEELHELLVDAVRLRLRADVPVGAYLSGGLDSSTVTALVKRFTDTPVETFSIAFHDQAYDESGYQLQMADFLGTRHHQIQCSNEDIAAEFPAVIRHAERPILRTAPTPLYMLSALVRQHNFKVVLTGEGADEMLGGYDIFKETLIRRFWARQPNSAWRPLLLQRLYPTLPLTPGRARFYLEAFYRSGIDNPGVSHFSHIPRLNTTTRVKDFFSDDVRAAIGGVDSLETLVSRLPEDFSAWHHLARAQYLEQTTLLSGYLLSSQGDRVSAAHAIEARYPFLDHRVAEFAASLPPGLKIRGLKEKYLLKRAMRAELPAQIIGRVKQPYMAPDSNCFFHPRSPEYVLRLLDEGALTKYGLFRPDAVRALVAKCARLSHAHLSFKDNMAFIGVLSSQLLCDQYLDGFSVPKLLEPSEFSVWRQEQHYSDAEAGSGN